MVLQPLHHRSKGLMHQDYVELLKHAALTMIVLNIISDMSPGPNKPAEGSDYQIETVARERFNASGNRLFTLK
jgi:hypothetical protein